MAKAVYFSIKKDKLSFLRTLVDLNNMELAIKPFELKK